MTWTEIELKIYDEQEKFIKERYGDEAARIANYGWGVHGDKDCISVATKVYRHGILVSESGKDGKIIHSMEPF